MVSDLPRVHSNGGDQGWHEQLQPTLTKCFESTKEGDRNCSAIAALPEVTAFKVSINLLCRPYFPELYRSSHLRGSGDKYKGICVYPPQEAIFDTPYTLPVGSLAVVIPHCFF